MFSKVVRQTHMYFGLFMTPWMLMYALSSIVMNHRASFKDYYGGALVKWDKEKEQQYAGQFTPDSDPEFMGAQIMNSLGLDGNFNAQMSRDRKRLTLMRTDPVTPRRIVYTPEDGKLLVEKQEFRTQPFLEGLHRRRGFRSTFLLDDLWGITVDLAIVAMVLWVLSGLWMWWELKVTRKPGAIFMLSGAALFTLFLLSI
jgi:hypothetical protein